MPWFSVCHSDGGFSLRKDSPFPFCSKIVNHRLRQQVDLGLDLDGGFEEVRNR